MTDPSVCHPERMLPRSASLRAGSVEGSTWNDFLTPEQSYILSFSACLAENPGSGPFARVTANLKAKKILVGRDRLIEENGPLVRCIECVAHATRRDTGGPRDAVEGRAVEAASQAGSADRIWS